MTKANAILKKLAGGKLCHCKDCLNPIDNQLGHFNPTLCKLHRANWKLYYELYYGNTDEKGLYSYGKLEGFIKFKKGGGNIE
tara:strand:+ start:1066 stop:1311 length:246 start_codon:yes stop_codon:yes gene_type:complete